MPTLVAGFHRPLVRHRSPHKLVNLLYSLDLRPNNSHLDSQNNHFVALSSKLSVFYDPVVLVDPDTSEKISSTPALRINPKDGLSYVWVPQGSFTMGCSAGDELCSANEKPA